MKYRIAKRKAVLKKDMKKITTVNKYFYGDITEKVFMNLKIDDKIKVIFYMLNDIGLMCEEIKANQWPK